MKAYPKNSIIGYAIVACVSLALGWGLASLNVPPKVVDLKPVEPVPPLPPTPAAQGNPPRPSSTALIRDERDQLEQLIDEVNSAAKGDRTEFDKRAASAMKGHDRNEFVASQLAHTIGQTLEGIYHDDAAAAVMYRQAAVDATTLIVKTSNMRATAYEALARTVEKQHPEEAILAYRRIVETFEELETYTLIGYGLPTRKEWHQSCRQTYDSAVTSLAQMSEADIREIGYVAPSAYRYFSASQPALTKEILWLRCGEAKAYLGTRKTLLSLATEYVHDDEDKKNHAIGTLREAVLIVDDIARVRSNQCLEGAERSNAARNLRRRLRYPDLP